jgi:hypothetical protein
MRHTATLLAFIAVTLFLGCRGRAARSSDDIVICKQFYNEAVTRMSDLKRDTFQPGDLTFEQLRGLTPSDPDWRGAEFLVLKSEWRCQKERTQIVIVCGQSRVSKSGDRVHCVGYSNGETAWLREDDLAKLQLRDFAVLPKLRP